MMSFYNFCDNKRWLIFLMGVSFMFSGLVYAETSLLEKGAEFLKSLGGGKKSDNNTLTPTKGDIEKAFKEALRIGSDKVVTKLSAVNGFYADPKIRIPVPEDLKPVKDALYKIGLKKDVDKFEEKLNRAAEVAVPKAKALFVKSISKMTFKDVMDIYEGPKDSATQYFRKKMSPSLGKEMHPIVESSLSEVGAIKALKQVMKKYNQLPYVPKINSDITGYVVQKGMDGVFFYLAREEAAIRENPEKQTTALLKKVFGVK